MKKILSTLLCLLILLSLCSTAYSQESFEENETLNLSGNLKTGDYFTLGKYNNEPILWRYVADDENGKLIVSAKVLCNKPFGETNFWKKSALRKWLNSDVSDGEDDWTFCMEQVILDYCSSPWDINNEERPMSYSKEKGFLNESNFSRSERTVMKSVIQWTMLPQSHLNLSENGEKNTYSNIKKYTFSNPPEMEIYNIYEIPNIFSGAAHQLADTVFLLDEMQIYRIWSNFDTLLAMNTEKNLCGYFLRTPTKTSVCGINANAYGSYTVYNINKAIGIRPAFYLNEECAYIKSGSGTADDPYIMDGIEKAVYINNAKAEMKEPPITVEGIVMVPMQETFEKLGANVIYDEETQAVTAELNGKYIYTLTDNKGILINGECDDMGYPMTMVFNKPYVPLSAIEKSVTPNVQWNNDLQQLNIWTE